jgi:hypothetical protein
VGASVRTGDFGAADPAPGQARGHTPASGGARARRLLRRGRAAGQVRALPAPPATRSAQAGTTAVSGPGDGPGTGTGGRRGGNGGGSGGGGDDGSGGGDGGGRPGRERGRGCRRPRSGDVARLPGPLLRHRAQRHPQHVPGLPYPGAAVTGTAGCSFAELDRRARAVAARLGALLRPGSRVMLAYPQGPDLAGALFGCLYAGMAAIPVVLPGPGATGTVPRAVQRCLPDLVLIGADTWTPLAVDRTRTRVLEADGIRVGGEPVWRLAQSWRPVGVLRTAPAYQRYHDDGAAGGRLEAAMGHGDLTDVMDELAQAVRLGTDEENVGWIAAVHGVEDAVWRVLLPVRVTG